MNGDFDVVLAEALRSAVSALSGTATDEGIDSIREKKHVQAAVRQALTARLGETVLPTERILRSKHWQGVPNRWIGGVDILVTGGGPGDYLAFIELKWCPLDGLFLSWAIHDFYKMATFRDSPGAESCYLVAGAPSALWARTGTVGELFRNERWKTPDVFARYEKAWIGNGDDCKKLTALPARISTVLVAEESLPHPFESWSIRAIRVEPEAGDWLSLVEGKLA
jgi:hypothetical protein